MRLHGGSIFSFNITDTCSLLSGNKQLQINSLQMIIVIGISNQNFVGSIVHPVSILMK